METIGAIGAIISIVAVITFFVMAFRLGTISSYVMQIGNRISDTPFYEALTQPKRPPSKHTWIAKATALFLNLFLITLISCEKQYTSEQVDLVTNDIYVNPNGSQDFTTIAAALNSITDNSITNKYNIFITGTFNEYSLSMKDYVNVIGYGPSVSKIVGYLPASTAEATIQWTSTIDCPNINFTLQNLYVSMQNGRYPIHSDAGAVPGNPAKHQKFINVTLEHLGNAEADAYWGHEVWTTLDALGMGLSDNMFIYIVGGEYTTAGTNTTSRGIAIHGVSGAAALSKIYITNPICRSGGTNVLRVGNLYVNADEYYFDNVSMYGNLQINGTAGYTDNTIETGTNPIILDGNIISD